MPLRDLKLKLNRLTLYLLKAKIKQIALNMGAKLVGVGSRERLKDGPPSADMDYCLPRSQSCIIWAHPYPFEAIRNYLSKKERMSIKYYLYRASSESWKIAKIIAKFIEDYSEYRAVPIIPNGKVRKIDNLKHPLDLEFAYPDFSLRYGAVAAGLGQLGWSGNLVTREYGGAIRLGGVLTTAPLEPDPIVKENPCNNCKVCVQACPTGFVSKIETEYSYPVILGGKQQLYSKRSLFYRCAFGCFGGVSEDEKWSVWAPNHFNIKKIPDERLSTIDFKQCLMKDMLSNKNIPCKVKQYNLKIIKGYAKDLRNENVGIRLLEDTNPTCGNCSIICVADHKKRVELLKMLKNSGKHYIDEKGREFIKKFDKNGKEIIYYPPTEENFFKSINKGKIHKEVIKIQAS